MIVDAPPLAAAQLRQAVDRYVNLVGSDRCHPWLIDLAAALGKVRQVPAGFERELPPVRAFVSHAEARDRLGCSQDTLRRLIDEHGLRRIGRRLLASEIERLATQGGAK